MQIWLLWFGVNSCGGSATSHCVQTNSLHCVDLFLLWPQDVRCVVQTLESLGEGIGLFLTRTNHIPGISNQWSETTLLEQPRQGILG